MLFRLTEVDDYLKAITNVLSNIDKENTGVGQIYGEAPNSYIANQVTAGQLYIERLRLKLGKPAPSQASLWDRAWDLFNKRRDK